MYMLVLLDTYAPTYAVLVIALFECIAVGWVYGLYTHSLTYLLAHLLTHLHCTYLLTDWHNLLRMITDTASFKKKLKAHFHNHAFCID